LEDCRRRERSHLRDQVVSITSTNE
jgi:hypothetical protein